MPAEGVRLNASCAPLLIAKREVQSPSIIVLMRIGHILARVWFSRRLNVIAAVLRKWACPAFFVLREGGH